MIKKEVCHECSADIPPAASRGPSSKAPRQKETPRGKATGPPWADPER